MCSKGYIRIFRERYKSSILLAKPPRRDMRATAAYSIEPLTTEQVVLCFEQAIEIKKKQF